MCSHFSILFEQTVRSLAIVACDKNGTAFSMHILVLFSEGHKFFRSIVAFLFTVFDRYHVDSVSTLFSEKSVYQNQNFFQKTIFIWKVRNLLCTYFVVNFYNDSQMKAIYTECRKYHYNQIMFGVYYTVHFVFEKCSKLNMEKSQRLSIYMRIHREFNVIKFKKYYYCSQNNYFQLIDKLREKFGGSAKIMVRTDHVVVKGTEGTLRLFLLCSHSSGKCASFLH